MTRVAVNVLRAFNIDIFKLSNSKHDYQFEIDKSFFEEFENSPIKVGNANVHVELDKSATLMEVTIEVKGKVVLTCDRSLEEFDEEIDISNKMIFKYGDQWEELSDEIVVIPRDEQRLNVAHYIFEFVILSLPIKKIHPNYRDEEFDGVYYASDNDKNKSEANDPRWNKLKDLLK